MSDNPIKDFEQLARDAVYAAVGFGVLGFQKAQVRRREIADALAERGVDLSQIRATGQPLKPPVESLRPQIDALRPQAEAIATQLRAAAVALRPQIESLSAGVGDLLKSVDEHSAPVRHEVEARVSDIEEHLPPGARAGVAQLRARAAAQEETLRWLIGLLTHDSGSSEPGESPPDEPPAME